MYNVVGADFQNESYFHSFTYARAELPFNHLVIQLRGNYRVFQLILTDFEDLGGQLKTTFRYLYIPEVWAFEFHQKVFKKIT